MNNATNTTKAKQSGACGGVAPGDPAAVDGFPTTRRDTPYEMPQRTPTIAELLATRPDSLSTLDEALAVLHSIQVFRTILDDVADPLKAKIGKEGCPDAYFFHGLGVLNDLEERDRQLADLERRVKGVRIGARPAAAPRAHRRDEGRPKVEVPAEQPVRLAQPATSGSLASDAPVGGADPKGPATSPGGTGVAAA